MQESKDLLPGLLRPAEAAVYLSMSRSRLWKLSESDPTFPRKIVIGPRCVGWRRESLDEYLKSKEQAA